MNLHTGGVNETGFRRLECEWGRPRLVGRFPAHRIVELHRFSREIPLLSLSDDSQNFAVTSFLSQD